MWDIVEKKQDRRALWEQMQALNAKAGDEKREFTAEEQEQWNRMDADLSKLTAVIERQERLLAMEDKEADRVAQGIKPTGVATPQDDAYDKAFRSWLAFGHEGLTPEQRGLMQARFVENRALGVGAGATGGFLVPQGFYQRIITSLREVGGIRDSRAYIIPTATGNLLPIPTTDDTANSGVRIAENTAITALATTYGQRTLGAFMYTSRIIQISLQLLQDAAFDMERHLAEVMGTRIGRITNEEFTLGTGTTMPRGVVTDATSGVAAGAGNSTSITYANLVAMEHSVDPAYRRRAEWMFHDTTLRALKQMVDSQGRPLWVPGMAVREPDTLMGYRYVVNQNMAVMAANARSILFGDFSKFFVRDVQDMQVLRLTERYAEFLQVGFLAYSRHDSVLTDTAAVRFYQNSAT